jgi:hypothetical protein
MLKQYARQKVLLFSANANEALAYTKAKPRPDLPEVRKLTFRRREPFNEAPALGDETFYPPLVL